MRFFGRQQELQLLEERCQSLDAELVVVYGRRQVGKTEMLRLFCEGKKAIYFTASEAKARDNLEQLVGTIAQALPDPLLEHIHFKDLEAVLSYLADKATERLVLVLDEFPYWASDDESIPSLIQRFWDARGKHSALMLILCGSSIRMMLEYTLAETAPLYGRRTAQIKLEAFDYKTAAQFFPSWSSKDKLIAYGIVGGMPSYLAQFEPKKSLVDNIKFSLLRKGAFLSDEANMLLRTELDTLATYTSILRAVAGGSSKMSDITNRLNMDARKTSAYLAKLQSLSLIQREVSFDEPAPEKNRHGRYVIQDHFLRFWFRFVESNVSLVDTHRGEALLENIILPQLNTYMGKAFEMICQQYLLLYSERVHLPVVKRIGRIWRGQNTEDKISDQEKNFDIDIAAENIDGSYTFAECKWSSRPVSAKHLLGQLQKRVSLTSLRDQKKHFVLFSIEGFIETQKALGDEVVLVDQKALFD